MNNIKILIVDDHVLIRDGIKLALQKKENVKQILEVGDGEKAIEMARIYKPDIIIMDISLPTINGMQVSQVIIEENPRTNIIILSMFIQEEYIRNCLQIGVKGYVPKNAGTDELMKAINVVIEGGTYYSSSVHDLIFKKYTQSLFNPEDQNIDNISLTQREKEVGKYVVQGYTSQQIADKLFISARTVDTHRANLMKKLNVKNSVELVNMSLSKKLFDH